MNKGVRMNRAAIRVGGIIPSPSPSPAQHITHGRLHGTAVALSLAVLALLLTMLALRFEGGIAIAAPTSPNAWTWDGSGYVSVDGATRIPGAIAKGVDASGYDGELDWDALKAAGIDFAILRCGEVHRNYSTDESGLDIYFVRNRSECERLGIPYGIYYRSHATTVDEAASEAEHAVALIAGSDPVYPVYLDIEDSDMASTDNNALFAQMTRVFCERLAAEGYKPGVYGSLYWFNTFFTDAEFDRWPRWVADWKDPDDDVLESPLCRYAGDYTMWQATSFGVLPGFNGHCDINFAIDPSAVVDEPQPAAPQPAAPLYYDVPSDVWFAQYVEYVTYFGVMTGYRDGNGAVTGAFGPYDGITRAQVATILYRMSNPGSAATTDPGSYGWDSGFSDVAGGLYCTEAIRWCKAQGIVTGYLDASGASTGFHPDALITREELATMIARYASFRGWDISGSDQSWVLAFPDGGMVSGYAVTPMAWCVAHSIITGNAATNPPQVKPHDTATRAEAAKMFGVLIADVLG